MPLPDGGGFFCASLANRAAACYSGGKRGGMCHEVWEETGLTLTDYRFRAVVTFVADGWDTEYMHLFTATGYTGELKECDEGNLEWVPKEKVYDLPIWEGDKLFFRLIEDPDSPFFSLKMEYQGDKLVRAVLDGKELPR